MGHCPLLVGMAFILCGGVLVLFAIHFSCMYVVGNQVKHGPICCQAALEYSLESTALVLPINVGTQLYFVHLVV